MGLPTHPLVRICSVPDGEDDDEEQDVDEEVHVAR